MKIKITFLLLILFISCKNEVSKNNGLTEISLEIKNIENPFGGMNRPLQIINEIPKKFKGIIKKDSSFLASYTLVSSKKLEVLLKKNVISEETFKKAKTKLFVLSGIKNGKQFFIADINMNKDFSDDQIHEFDKSISSKIKKNQKLKHNFQTFEISFDNIENETLYEDKILLQIYPNSNYFQRKNEKEEEKFKNSLQLIAFNNSFLYGDFIVENEEYKVAISDFMRENQMFISKKNIPFKFKMENINSVSDTIKLNGKHFKIEKVNEINKKLIFKELKIENKKYGYKTGERSKNFKVQDLNLTKSDLKKVLGEKKLLFIDFWGTWCEPCKELTPDIVALHEKYKDDISFMSLAFEEDVEPVKKYVFENKMNWYNGIIIGKPKSGDMSSEIISGLRIECYPTFLLLDPNLNIIYRNCGGKFSEILEFIKNEQIEWN